MQRPKALNLHHCQHFPVSQITMTAFTLRRELRPVSILTLALKPRPSTLRARAGCKAAPLEVTQRLPWDEAWKKTFLAEYWQKRPVLIRNALGEDFVSPIDKDQLAGLACDPDVRSRVYVEEGAERPWQLFEGPFDEAFYAGLPESKWQLLVNGVDRLVPEVADLLNLFTFVPRWRLDDVMVSVAAPQGGVGPHSDSFDVFLLQGEGRKRWSVSVDRTYVPDDPDAHLPDLDVRILADFQADASWELGPGDMLYVPPHYGHEGVGLDEGQTLSIGFLAPRHEEMLLAFVSEALMRVDGSARYRDAGLELQEHPGEVSEATVRRVQALLDHIPRGYDEVASWFGRHVSEPRGLPEPCPPEQALTQAQLKERLAEGDTLCRNESTRILFARSSTGTVTMFVDGLEYLKGVEWSSPEAGLIRALADSSRLNTPDQGPQDEASWELLLDLVNDGHLYFYSDRGEFDSEAQEDLGAEYSDDDTDSGIDAGCMDVN